MTYKYLEVTYDYLRVTYRWHTDDIVVDMNGQQMTYKYIKVTCK